MIKETTSLKQYKLKGFSGFLLKLLGWKLEDNKPNEMYRCVMIMAPHTSNWDFVIGRLAMSAYGFSPVIFVKKEAFIFPIGGLLKKLGCMPIDRTKAISMVDYVAQQFEGKEEFVVFITPEGTRGKVKDWKSGFHRIATKADVPVVCSYMDYKNKQGGFGPVVHLTGDYQADLQEIQGFYKERNPLGKFAENGVY